MFAVSSLVSSTVVIVKIRVFSFLNKFVTLTVLLNTYENVPSYLLRRTVIDHSFCYDDSPFRYDNYN
jgi:hypothetical protein